MQDKILFHFSKAVWRGHLKDVYGNHEQNTPLWHKVWALCKVQRLLEIYCDLYKYKVVVLLHNHRFENKKLIEKLWFFFVFASWDKLILNNIYHSRLLCFPLPPLELKNFFSDKFRWFEFELGILRAKNYIKCDLLEKTNVFS